MPRRVWCITKDGKLSAYRRVRRPAGRQLGAGHSRLLTRQFQTLTRGQLQCFIEVFCEHSCCESIFKTICSFDHFFNIFELQY